MKKFASLLLTVVMLATMLTVFTIPAFAEDVFTEISPDTYKVTGNCIVSKPGDYEVDTHHIESGSTMILGRGVTVTINTINFHEGATLIVYGTFNILDGTGGEQKANVKIVRCSGGSIQGRAPHGIESVDHYRVNGVCLGCGDGCSHEGGFINSKCKDCDFVCLHEKGFTNSECNVCDYVCTHEGEICTNCGTDLSIKEESTSETSENGTDLTGSTLSEGSLTIICTVAAAVVFGLGGFFVGKAARKKKKPAVAGGTDNTDEE